MKIILNYFQDAAVTLSICVPLYVLFRFLYIKIKKPKIQWKREIVFGIFVLYLLWLASETLLPEFNLQHYQGKWSIFYDLVHRSAGERISSGNGINLTPFMTIDRFTNFRNFGMSMVNLVGNIVMFIPLGYLIPLLWEKTRRFWKILLIGIFLSCFIECFQLFIDRTVDVDDVLLNTIGVILGYLIAFVCFKAFPNQKKKYLAGENEKI